MSELVESMNYRTEFLVLMKFIASYNPVAGSNSWKQALSLSVMTVACRRIISSAVGDRQSWAAASARVADAIQCTR